MIEKEDYDNGLRCRGICKCCIETSLCYQYKKDIKGTEYDFIKKEDKKMKINDLRKKTIQIEIDELKCGDWFIYYNELYRVSNYDTECAIPCIRQMDGERREFIYGTEVTPVEVEINIIS